jgi:hypothetical protein
VLFDGVDNSISLGAPNELANLAPLTACVWLRLAATPPVLGPIAGKFIGVGVGGGWTFFVDAAGLVGFASNYGDTSRATLALELDQWRHVCATWDGNPGPDGQRIYLDGQPQSLDETPANTMLRVNDTANELLLGQTGDGLSTLSGSLDEFFLFDRVLTPEEVLGIHACAP